MFHMYSCLEKHNQLQCLHFQSTIHYVYDAVLVKVCRHRMSMYLLPTAEMLKISNHQNTTLNKF